MDKESLEDALTLIRRGTEEILSEGELAQKLLSGRQLVIKAGFDPTAPDLHLGHTVLFRKLRHFQELGHKVIFLIGDATGLVGDPSGQSKTRQVLSWEDVRDNAATYQEQVKTLLLTDRKRYEVRYNSEWYLGASPQMRQQGLEQFDFMRMVDLASRATVARLIERDDFSKRLKDGKPVSILELFYPLMQGYDSVKISEQHGSCDVEIGGTDQKFNLLMGRELQKAYGFEPQVVLTLPLLEGTDGLKKMSKSLGNHIGIREVPGEIFGKLMSIPDELIVKYYTLLTDAEEGWIEQLGEQLQKRSINPRDAKLDLAHLIATMYHGAAAADSAKDEFLKVFSRKEEPSDMTEVTLSLPARILWADFLVENKLAPSKKEARRLIASGAVKLDSRKLEPSEAWCNVSSENTLPLVLQVGPRKFLRLIFK